MGIYNSWVQTLTPDDAFSWGFIFGFILFGLLVLFLLVWLKQVREDVAKNKAERKKDIMDAVKAGIIEGNKERDEAMVKQFKEIKEAVK